MEDTVKLISAEGFEFVIDRKAAMVSNTIRNMLTSPGFVFFTLSDLHTQFRYVIISYLFIVGL